MPIQVNINTQVNSASIRRETYNGREHWVIPSYTLPANVVMNGGLYPEAEINAHYQKIEGTLAPLGHPTVNGQFVSAFSPEGINIGHIGAWNRNVQKVGNRVAVEKWLDIEFAKNTEGGRRLIERLEAIERGDEVDAIHTSIAVFLEREPATNAEGYDWVARINSVDHDAILLDEPGAATPEQGVGLMVNADQATPIQANAGALGGESYRDKERRLEQAARERFVTGDNDYIWVADFTETQAILVRNGGDAERYDYADEDGDIRFGDAGTPVERRESWITKIPVINHLFNLFTHRQARPDHDSKEGDMPLTSEEKAELAADITKSVAANMAEQLQPLAQRLETLETNHQQLSETLTANQRAEEATKREAVAAKFGKAVAEGLTGNALDELYKQCDSAPALAGNGRSDEPKGAPDPNEYFAGGAQ